MWGIVHGEREATSTRERICWNGPWRWQRAGPVNGSVPERRWGYCKVPGAWSGITDCMQNDSQSVLSPRNGATCDWVDLPPHGTRVGEVRFPDGELDLSGVCRPGEVHRLSLRVTAMPLQAVLQSYTDSAAAREVKGAVARRGLCGDVHLIGGPRGPRPGGVRVSTSVWRGEPLEWFGIVRSEVKWSGRRESNPHDQLGRLELYH